MDAPVSPKIEELRARVKADAKSRHFYPLAEELRKAGRFAEAEEYLLNGLAAHPSYLAAWVSLGRVLRDTGKFAGAVEAFNKALILDPENVVAARLLAETYLSLGEKIEAIKKFKLVHVLLPQDQDVVEQIDRLDRELNPQKYVVAPPPPPPPPVAPEPAEDVFAAPEEDAAGAFAPGELPPEEPAVPAPLVAEDTPFLSAAPGEDEPESAPFFAEFAAVPSAPAIVGDAVVAAVDVDALGHGGGAVFAAEPEPFAMPAATPEDVPFIAASEESIFDSSLVRTPPPAEEPPVAGGQVESPSPVEEPVFSPVPPDAGIAVAPDSEELPWEDQEDSSLPAIDDSDSRRPSPAEVLNTTTMADLYARQGHHEAARRIYESVLSSDPSREDVRTKLAALPRETAPPSREELARRLEGWLQKVGRREDRDSV